MLYSSVYYVRSCFYFFLASREVGFPEHEKIFWCFRPSMFNNCKQVNNETVSNVNFCGITAYIDIKQKKYFKQGMLLCKSHENEREIIRKPQVQRNKCKRQWCKKGMTGLYHRHNKMDAHCITLISCILRATKHRVFEYAMRL